MAGVVVQVHRRRRIADGYKIFDVRFERPATAPFELQTRSSGRAWTPTVSKSLLPLSLPTSPSQILQPVVPKIGFVSSLFTIREHTSHPRSAIQNSSFKSPNSSFAFVP